MTAAGRFPCSRPQNCKGERYIFRSQRDLASIQLHGQPVTLSYKVRQQLRAQFAAFAKQDDHNDNDIKQTCFIGPPKLYSHTVRPHVGV